MSLIALKVFSLLFWILISWIHTYLLLSLCLLVLSSADLCVFCWIVLPSCGWTDVSTITYGWTTISVEEYCDGSSDIFVKDKSEGIRRGYFILRLDLVALIGSLCNFTLGDDSGEGVGILSALSFGLICKVHNNIVLSQYSLTVFFWYSLFS